MTVQQTTLNNGLRIITDSLTHVESITLGIWLDVGTRDEPPEMNGAAHMLEHMAFKGTTNRSARQIAEEIEAVGGEMNAYTSIESTAYHIRILKEDVRLALDILGDILQNSVFDPQELSREQAVVVQEIGQANDTPEDVIYDNFQATCFPNQAIGRPTLGTIQSVQSLTSSSIRKFMEDRYGTQRMILAAAGNLHHDAFVKLAETYFSGLKANTLPERHAAQYHGGDNRTFRDLEQVHLLLGFEGLTFQDPDYYACSILMTILGGGMSSRLFQEIREKRGLAYAIYAYSTSYRDSGLISVYAGTGEHEISELLPAVCEELKHLPGTLTLEELKKAKAQLKAGLMMSLESTTARCRQLANHMLIYGHPIPPKETLEKVDKVSLHQLQHLGERLFHKKPTLATLGPVHHVADYETVCKNLGVTCV